MKRITLAVVVFLALFLAGTASAQEEIRIDNKGFEWCNGIMDVSADKKMITLPKREEGHLAGLLEIGRVCIQFQNRDMEAFLSAVTEDGRLPAYLDTQEETFFARYSKMLLENEKLKQQNNRQAAMLRRQSAALNSLKNQLKLAEVEYDRFKTASVNTITRMQTALNTETAAKETETGLRKTAEAKAEAASNRAYMWGWVSGVLGFLCVSGLAFGFVFLPAAFDKAYKNGAKSTASTITTATPSAAELLAEYGKGHAKGYAEGRVSGMQEQEAKQQPVINGAVQQALMTERAATQPKISELEAKLAAATQLLQQQQPLPLQATGTTGGNNLVPFRSPQPPANYAGSRPAFTPPPQQQQAPPQPQPPAAIQLTAAEQTMFDWLESQFQHLDTVLTNRQEDISPTLMMKLSEIGVVSVKKIGTKWRISKKFDTGEFAALPEIPQQDAGALLTKLRSEMAAGETREIHIGQNRLSPANVLVFNRAHLTVSYKGSLNDVVLIITKT